MKRIIETIEVLSRWAAYLAGLFMLLIVGLISLEIFLRTFFKTSTMISDEYSAYFMVFSVFLGLAYTLKEENHIKITLLTSRIKDPLIACIWDTIVLFVALGLSLFILYHATSMVYETRSLDMRADSIAETPLWIPELGVPLGFLFLSLQLVAMILQNIQKIGQIIKKSREV